MQPPGLRPGGWKVKELSWKRTFLFAFIAQLLGIVGVSFATPFLPFFVKEMGVTDGGSQAFWAGMVMASGGVMFAIMAPVWGSLADRYGRKPMVCRAMFGAAVSVFLMSFARSVPQMIVCRVFQGAFSGTLSASIALVASVTPHRRSGFALGMMQAAVFIGNALGPLIGGYTADHFGYRASFRIGALLTVLGGLLILFGTVESFTQPQRVEDTRSNGFRKILILPGFAIGVLILFSVRLGNSLANPAFPLIVGDLLKTPEKLNRVTGAVIGAAAIAAAASAAILGHAGDRWGRKRILVLCCVGGFCGALGHFAARNLWELLGARIMFGFSMAGMLPAANATIHEIVDRRSIGKAYGLATSLSMLGSAVGPSIGGTIAKHSGLRTPFLATAMAQVALMLLVIGLYPKPRKNQDPRRSRTAS